MGLKDAIIKMAIRRVLRDSNEKINFTELITSSGSDSDLNKKLVIRITDMSSVTGLGIQNGAMVEVEKVENPDTVFSMTKQTFSAIVMDKIDHRQAYWMGAIEADGTNWVRDSLLLGKIFDEVKRVIKR